MICHLLNAQETTKKLTYGFNFNIIKSDFNLGKTFYSSDVFINNTYGFGLGIFSQYQISELISINLKSSLNFVNSYVYFLQLNENANQYNIMQTAVDIKSHFNLKTSLHKNSPYFIIGPNLKLPLYDKNQKNNSLFYKNRMSALLDLGFGINLKKKSVIFAPEFVYSFGLNNINSSPLLTHVYYNQFALILNFKN